MIKKITASALFSTLVSYSCVSFANDVNTNTEVTNLQESKPIVNQAKNSLLLRLTGLKSLSASFHQQIIDSDNNLLQEGEGNFILAKPNLLSWQTTSPDESTITSDGETIWLFDPFIEQVTAYSLSRSIANTPILLLTNEDEQLWNNYDISLVEEHKYRVVSKDVDAQVKALTLQFDNQGLSGFSIFDATGQQSKFVLLDTKQNFEYKVDSFKFDIPEGVLLDDQR